jgi:hypothetical protein
LKLFGKIDCNNQNSKQKLLLLPVWFSVGFSEVQQAAADMKACDISF